MGNPRINMGKSEAGKRSYQRKFRRALIKAKMVVKLSQRVFKEFVVSLLKFPGAYDFSGHSNAT